MYSAPDKDYTMADAGCETHQKCVKALIPIKDSLDILSGKWKILVIMSLVRGNKRFSQLAREIPGITDKMLSKELRDLEMNMLVKRTVSQTMPVMVEYAITDYGRSLKGLIDTLRDWGSNHRDVIMQRTAGNALQSEQQ